MCVSVSVSVMMIGSRVVMVCVVNVLVNCVFMLCV